MCFIYSNDTKHIFWKLKLNGQQSLAGSKKTEGTQKGGYLCGLTHDESKAADRMEAARGINSGH